MIHFHTRDTMSSHTDGTYAPQTSGFGDLLLRDYHHGARPVTCLAIAFADGGWASFRHRVDDDADAETACDVHQRIASLALVENGQQVGDGWDLAGLFIDECWESPIDGEVLPASWRWDTRGDVYDGNGRRIAGIWAW